ncbi:unnamed protein product [Staurois parvus]|uniref:Uncharacterized protein n=1 Tax=Staurois parvus TaxID=386267 RepID=A0ABN9FUH0_9NEOB|nr:unnamed protein product [Staurois parvus]
MQGPLLPALGISHSRGGLTIWKLRHCPRAWDTSLVPFS